MATTKPRRTAACNPELEASIDEAPDDAERYWIYGDWLESQGDPRGQVIAAARTSRKRERALLEKYGAQLLGPLARIKGSPGAAPLRWRYGFIERARLRRRSATPSLAEQIELVLAHPSARFLRHLSLRTPDHGDDTPGYRQVLELAARRAPRTLASLALGEGGESIGDLGDALGALPSLRALCLFADTAHLDPKSTEGVVSLSVQRIRAREPALLQACAWPSLRHLELHYDYVRAAWSEGPPLPLGEDRFPRLRSVTVHFSRAWRGEVLLQLFDVTHMFGMRLRPELVLLQKTMVQVEGVARSIDPAHNIWQAAKPIVDRWTKREFGPEGLKKLAVATAREAMSRLRKLPETLQKLDDALARAAEPAPAPVVVKRTTGWGWAFTGFAIAAASAAGLWFLLIYKP